MHADRLPVRTFISKTKVYARLVAVFSLLLLLSACQTALYTGLTERDAMQMVTVLQQHGIDASRVITKDGTSTLEVPHAHVADAVTVLQAAHFPRNSYEDMGKVFQTQGLISTPDAERAKLYFGISQELEHTLVDIDGVVDARVHIAPAINDPVTGETRPATASVVMRYDADATVDGLLPKIKLMVANAVQDLSYEHVSVIMLPVKAKPAPVIPKTSFVGLAIAGWVLAVLWPIGGLGWFFWHRRQKTSPPVTGMRLVASRERVTGAA